jgi:hypothetical protein
MNNSLKFLLVSLLFQSVVCAGTIKNLQELNEHNVKNPLMQAFYSHNLLRAQQLLKDRTHKNHMKEIILVATLEQGGPFMDEKVRLLIEYGANPIKKTTAQDTALNTAVAYKRWNSLQTILACAHVQARLQPE